MVDLADSANSHSRINPYRYLDVEAPVVSLYTSPTAAKLTPVLF